jgi:hypothetical protein
MSQQGRPSRRGRKLGFQQLEARDLLASHTTNGVRVMYLDQVTDETGKAITVYVDLLAAPAASVTFSVYSSNTNEGTTPTTSLTFTPSNWGGGFNIIVTGKDDPFPGTDDGNQAYGLCFGLMQSNDPTYDGKSMEQSHSLILTMT